MNFLTQEEIKEASKDEMTALECSLKHHQQGRDATSLELQVAINSGNFQLGPKTCSCCISFDKCAEEGDSDCPLDEGFAGCCLGLYGTVYPKKETFRLDPSNANHAAFQEAEGKVVDYIQGVIDKKKKQIADEAKPKPKHLDIVRYRANSGYVGDGVYINTFDEDRVLYYRDHDQASDASSHGEFEHIYGNLADDAKALQETVTEFEMKTTGARSTKNIVSVGNATSPNNLIYIHLKRNIDNVTHFTLKEFEAFTMNCRKKLATLKRNK